jgi:hypothetical protein
MPAEHLGCVGALFYEGFGEEIGMATRKSKTPGTLKEVLSGNVRHQQRRSDAVASPPEAQRTPHQRIKDAERKRRQQKGE